MNLFATSIQSKCSKPPRAGFYRAVKGRLRTLEAGCDTTVWLAMQPNSSLVPGEVYFDRAVAFKHFSGMGTEYKWEAVEDMVGKLDDLAGLGPQ